MEQVSPKVSTGTSLESVASGMGNVNSLIGEMRQKDKKDEAFANKTIEKIEAEPKPTPPVQTKGPDEKDFHTDPMQTFGSAAMFLATFGSLLTRHPLTTALNSASAVMQAANQKDATSFSHAFDKWKIDSEHAWKTAQWDMDQYKAALGKDDTEAKIYAASSKNDTAKYAIEAKLGEQYHKDAERNLKNAQSSQKAVVDYVDEKEKRAKESGMSESDIILEKPKWFGEALSGAKASSAKPGTSSLDEKTIDRLARQYVNSGDSSVLTGAVRGRSSDAQATMGALEKRATELMDELNIAPEEMTKKKLQMAGAMTEARKVGNISGGIEFAANSLEQSLPVLEDAIKKVDMTQFSDINAFDNYVSKHTGDPNIVALNTALQATKSDYSTLIARNGVRSVETDRKADDLVNTAFAEKQFGAFIKQVKKEKTAQKKATKISQDNVGTWNGGLSDLPPSDDDIRMLLRDHSDEMKGHFDEAFGKGSAEKALRE